MKYAKILNGIVDSISIEQPLIKQTRKIDVTDEKTGEVTQVDEEYLVPDPYFIECPDNVFAGFEYDGVNFTAPPPPLITREQVNDERERRIEAGFMFASRKFDFDAKSKANISGAAQMAFMAIVAGSPAGNLRWHGGTADFGWIDAADGFLPMDAQTAVAFGQTAAGHESQHVFAAWAVKAMSPIPRDYVDNKYWP